MPITRDQASRLLTQPEMALFGDSRNPALRALTEKALATRIERTRKLRDKSRDLFQRQTLKSRDRTGSKLGTFGDANQRTAKKAEILDEILQRFESRLEVVQQAAQQTVPDPVKGNGRAVSPQPASPAKSTTHPKPATRKSRDHAK